MSFQKLTLFLLIGCGNEPVLGNSSVCMVSQPETLSVIDGIIYVGNTVSAQDSSSHGVYLSLSYSKLFVKATFCTGIRNDLSAPEV